jgi:hypothetical protein
MTRPSKPLSKLSESATQRLNGYALAAGAAGVGVLALAHPVGAKIVYTPAHVKIVPNHGEIFFDLNHDGVNDFGFYAHTARTTSGFLGFLDVGPARLRQGDAVLSIQNGRHACAAALAKGARVGPPRPFNSNNVVMAFVSSSAGGKSTAFCPWVGLTKSAYLGLKFAIMGKTHFGWARVGGGFLTGYAYETIPGKSINAGQTREEDETAPETGTLGGLARGAR